jgi:hypothetical protein
MHPPSRSGARRGLALTMIGIAVIATGWIALGLLIPNLVLPAGIRPPLREVFDTTPSPIYALVSPTAPLGGDSADLHVDVTSLDESAHVVTLRVSGHRACASTCAAEQLVLTALRPDESARRGLPPFMTVSLPDHDALVQATVQLPVEERLIQYPFDGVDLVLGVALQTVSSDSATQLVPSTEAATQLQLTLQEEVAQMELGVPVVLRPTDFSSPSMPLDYITVAQLTLSRKEALKLMTLLLLGLITGTALYTVMLRSLRDVVLGFGGLILGVWSVRAILVPPTFKERTGVDIALLVVIVFLLVVLGVRAARVIAPAPDPDVEPASDAVDEPAVASARARHANGWRPRQ